MKVFVKIIAAMFFLAWFPNVYAVDTHTKLWTSSIFVGSFPSDPSFKFYAEPQVRFVDSKYKFAQAIFWGAIGYEPTPKLVLYFGDAPMVSRTSSGIYNHDNAIWQQASYDVMDTSEYFVGSRSRLLQVKRFGESEWGLIFRQRLLARKPLHRWTGHEAVVSDEVFVDLNHPAWFGARSTLSQNRFFVGINTRLSKTTAILVGYMNQFQFYHPNEMSNILVISLEYDRDKYEYDDIKLS